MSRPLRRSVAVAVAAALVAATALAQDARTKQKGARGAQRTSGVITKVEDIGKREGRRLRLTIKTDVVWRDYVRDTAAPPPGQPLNKAAAEGKDSVATKGQPKSPDDVVTIEVGPNTRLESRFRAADETSAGSGTAGQAAAKAKGEGADTRRSARPARLAHEDLKTGLFVEVEYHRARGGENRAAQLAVIRPIDAVATPAAKEESKEAAKPDK